MQHSEANLKPASPALSTANRSLRSPERISGSTLALVNLVMLAGAAHGQATNSPTAPPQQPSSTNAPAKLPDVVVKGQQTSDYKPETVASPKYTVPLRDVPQTITVVPRAVFEQQGATTLRDVLRNVPGISYQAGEGGVPAGDNLSIRGFSARTDLFVDGVRDFGGYSRDPFNTEQVDVVKGPASAYAGRGSTGGSVNLVSKTPFLDSLYSGTLGFGTEDYKRFTLDMNQPLNDMPVKGTAVRVNAMWTDNDTPGRDVVTSERWGIAPSIALGLGTPTRFTLSYFHIEQDNIPDYGIPWVPTNSSPSLAKYGNSAPPVHFENFYGPKGDYEITRTDLPTAVFDHDFNEHFTLRNLTRYGVTTRDSVITSPRFVNATTMPDVINRQLQSRDQKDTILANQTDLTSRFETFKMEHTLVTGVEYDYETERNYARGVYTNGTLIAGGTARTAPTANLYNPDANVERLGPIERTGAYTDTKSDEVAVTAFDTLKITEQWQLSGGLRWDHFSVDYKSIATNGVPTAGTPLSRTDDTLSWRVGLAYKPLPNGTLYAGAGTSFNPSAEGLTLSTNLAQANFDLDPEETRAYEIGTKWDLLKNRLNVSLALFRIEKFNARTEDPIDPTDVAVLKGEQVVQGVELGAAGSITDEWKFFAGYAYMHSEITKSANPLEVGKRVNNTPEHSFTLWTTYKLPWNVEIGGGANYVGSRDNATAPPNTRTAPGYWLGDAMVAYNVTKHFTLRLNVYNLTDEKYIDRVGGGHFIPGQSRSAVLTASLKF